MKKIGTALLDLLYPKRCCFCGKISRKALCETCRKKVIYVEEPRCKKCGKPIRFQEDEYCHDCRRHLFFYEQGKSVWLHKEPVSTSIYQFKYHNKRYFAAYYAQELYRLYGDWMKRCHIEVIIPVPLHKKRRRKRGYNQAEVLAKELSKRSHIKVNKKAVVRVGETTPQKTLGRGQRKRNLKDAFLVTKHWEREKNVLIVDDIYTTGSTIDALAEKLREKGAEKVWFLTISIGQGF